MKRYMLEVKWGVIFTLVAILWMGLEKLLGWHSEKIDQHATLTNLFAIPAITVYVLALFERRRKNYANALTWKQGFVSGLLITAVVVILSPLAQFVTLKVISPEYFPNMIEYAVHTGQMTQVEAQAYFNFNSYIIQALIGAAVIGVITSAVVALFVQKKPTALVVSG